MKDADVLLENYAPGVMDRLGLGYAVLKEINPRLIYATGTGYGITGPDRDWLAMDHTIQADGGLMSVTGVRGGPPARAGGTPVDVLGVIPWRLDVEVGPVTRIDWVRVDQIARTAANESHARSVEQVALRL